MANLAGAIRRSPTSEIVGERFKSTLSAKRIAPGPPGVFGMDEIDITVVGHSDGGFQS